MATCHTCRELLGGYVLDALEPDERELVRRHIATCEQCAREHAELATMPALLDLAGSADAVPLRPPPRLEEAVLDRFARERRGAPAPPERRPGRRRRPRWAVPALAAVTAAAAAAVVIAVSGSDSGSGTRTGNRGSATLAPRHRVYKVALTGAGPLPLAAGEARLYPGQTGTGVHLRASGLEPRTYDYELWCVRDDGWKVSAGTFRADAAGNVDVHLTAAPMPTEYDTLAIQARRSGRAAGGRRVLSGRIRS
jgi:anti-sigma-K factor RskA